MRSRLVLDGISLNRSLAAKLRLTAISIYRCYLIAVGTCVRENVIERLTSHRSAVHLHAITIDVVTHRGCLGIVAVRSHVYTDVQVTANSRLSCSKPGLAIHREQVTLAVHSLAVIKTQRMYIRIVHDLECEDIRMSWLQDNILIQWNIGK